MNFAYDDKTVVEARGAGTASKQAAAAKKAGPALSDVLKAGQSVEVTYPDINCDVAIKVFLPAVANIPHAPRQRRSNVCPPRHVALGREGSPSRIGVVRYRSLWPSRPARASVRMKSLRRLAPAGWARFIARATRSWKMADFGNLRTSIDEKIMENQHAQFAQLRAEPSRGYRRSLHRHGSVHISDGFS
jgi:hypothetical protein